MSVEKGYSRYACDRAERAHRDGRKPIEYLQPADKRAKEWTEGSYTDTSGVEINLTLCPECSAKFRSILATHDRDMTEFMQEGM